MKTSGVYIKDMKPIDGSETRYYSMIINDKMVTYQTSGTPYSFHPHITKEQFRKMAVDEYKKENQD